MAYLFPNPSPFPPSGWTPSVPPPSYKWPPTSANSQDQTGSSTSPITIVFYTICGVIVLAAIACCISPCARKMRGRRRKPKLRIPSTSHTLSSPDLEAGEAGALKQFEEKSDHLWTHRLFRLPPVRRPTNAICIDLVGLPRKTSTVQRNEVA